MGGNADFNKNNLDCLRPILASIVFLFHISALTNLPAFSFFSAYLSPEFAVKSFFVISGLLIYRSYMRTSRLASYLEKRVRRIYPAYFTIVVLAAFGLCPLSTFHPLQYFAAAGFWKYLGANLIFLNFLAPSLPGVFQSNSISAVDGALWTLKIEVVFYLFVPVIYLLCARFGTRKVIGTLFCVSCIWRYGFHLVAFIETRGALSMSNSRSIYTELEVQFPGQLLYFCAGILLLLYFDKLRQHFLSISCITGFLFLLDHWWNGKFLDVFWISGVVFLFGFWRYFGNFSKHGDFSYGVYIVHWPVLQVMIALGLPRLNPVVFFLLSLSFVALASIMMWHLVESRFLATSSHYRQSDLKPSA